MSVTNPYKPAYPVGDSPAFVGRAELLREVVKVLRRSQDPGILLYGQRRIGKTSILRELLARLPKIESFHPVYFDLLDKTSWSLGQIVQDLVDETARQQGLPAPELGGDPETAFAESWLPEYLHGLPPGHILVFLLDEFGVLVDPTSGQSVNQSASSQFFPYLRALLARYSPQVKFVAVLSRSINEFSMVALQLFRGLRTLQVSLLSEGETSELVRLSEAGSESAPALNWEDAAVKRVWTLAHGHPLLTQQLCAEIWKNAYQADPRLEARVTPEDVESAVDGALEAGRNSLEWLWNGLPSAGRVVVSALAEAGANPITEDELTRVLSDSGVRVVIRELQEAPRLLQEWDLIEPGSEPYHFRVEMLRRWILKNKPLERVKEELDYIEPLAENLYQAAARMYQRKQSEQAVFLLRQAVDANPNHERASMLLADVLSALGRHEEALDILERLYLIRPFAIWPRLSRVLLEKARLAPHEDIQLELYERILEVEPMHSEAQPGRKRIWKGRGDQAMQEKRLEDAYEAYQNAGMADMAARLETQIRRIRLQNGLQELKRLESERSFQKGYELAQKLSGEFSGFAWEPVLKNFKDKSELHEMYERGLAALELDDRQTARLTLAQVAGRNPEYEEVTRYLHKAVSGIDVVEVHQSLVDARRALADLQQKLAARDAELATLRAERSAAAAPVAENAEMESMPQRTRQASEDLSSGLFATRLGELAEVLEFVDDPIPLLAKQANPEPDEVERAALARVGALFRALDEARQGHGRMAGMPLANEPLLQEIINYALEQGMMVFTGASGEDETNPNFAAWRPILRGVMGIDTELPVEMQGRQLRNRLLEVDAAYAQYLSKVSLAALQLPIPNQTVVRLLSPVEMQQKVEEIIVDCIQHRAAQTPLLLVFQSAQALDKLSADLLTSLAERLEHLPVAVILAYSAELQGGDLAGKIYNLPNFMEV